MRASSSRPHYTFALPFGEGFVFPMMPPKSPKDPKGQVLPNSISSSSLEQHSSNYILATANASTSTYQFSTHSVLEKNSTSEPNLIKSSEYSLVQLSKQTNVPSTSLVKLKQRQDLNIPLEVSLPSHPLEP